MRMLEGFANRQLWQVAVAFPFTWCHDSLVVKESPVHAGE